MPNHNITNREWLLVGFIILMGWFFSMKDTILKFDSMSANQLFLISYAVLYGFLYIASKYHGGIIIWNFQIKHPLQVFGTVLIIFSVFLVTTWENPYIQYVTKGNFDGISNIFYATEDGYLGKKVENMFVGYFAEGDIFFLLSIENKLRM